MLIGYDIGSSSVKASVVDSQSGRCIASAFYPKTEAPIISRRNGWAEQDPGMWWESLKNANAEVMEALKSQGRDGRDIKAIGISYQMHGLVCIDRSLKALRPSIIWCDSRAVPYGRAAYDSVGHEKCLEHLLNSPGNFTAAKLAWVRENEPAIFGKTYKFLLPGDYVAMRLTSEPATTVSGLSEGILWDFKENKAASFLLEALGIPEEMVSPTVPTFGNQGEVTEAAARELGLKAGVPVSYRAGDQPNNALSLNVFQPGEIAATAGTSGVVYGVNGEIRYDRLSRVNTFAHVNHTAEQPRLGALLCINGTGIMNSWARKNIVPAGLSYAEMNDAAATVPAGCDGVGVIPFGNGAERILQNREVGCRIYGIDLIRHDWKTLVRASQEGIAFSFRYGMDIMKEMGIEISRIHAGHANMFLSPLFREAISCLTGATIEMLDTDGAAGAARGAGVGCGIYRTTDEAFSSLARLGETVPDESKIPAYEKAYQKWKKEIGKA